MNQCFPSYFKYFILRVIGFIIFLAIIISENYFLILLLLITTFLETKVHCPKCKHTVGRSKNNIIMIISDEICKKCGQDLKRCEIEPDEITDKRL